MIIRTITCHHAFNQGAMLQAYALVTYLQSLGHDAKVIDYRPPYMGTVDYEFRDVSKIYSYPIIKQLYQLYRWYPSKMEYKRKSVLERFFADYICVTKERYSSIDELRKNPPLADIYIAGSDQIWNTIFRNGRDPAFYLDFGHPKRKISYAASFATDALVPGTDEFVKKHLNNFDAISVRESSGKRLVQSLGFKGIEVVDPVFLLEQKQWDLFGKGPATQDKYILVYDFEPGKSGIKRIAKRLAAMYGGCKIYTVTPSFSYFDYADKSFMICSPDEYVSLIKHAECVVSNSFHGTAFSMIYGKNFFVVNRKDGLNARMRDLLDHYHLSDRIIGVDAQSVILRKSVDYEKVNALLCQDIESSKSFLQHQIDLARE